MTMTSILLDGLKECARVKDLEKGKALHAAAVANGVATHIYVASSLVSMYSKCGKLIEAQELFQRMDHRNVVSWTALIMGYADNGRGREALDLFDQMRGESSCSPNSVTFIAALKACISLAEQEEGQLVEGNMVKVEALQKGREVHREVLHRKCCDLKLATTLVIMYGKCGCMKEARQAFVQITEPNVVSWTGLILGYAENGEGQEALSLFYRMNSTPDTYAFVAALKACTAIAEKEYGKQADGKLVKFEALEKGVCLHKEAADHRCHSEMNVCNTLVHMYAKCGCMQFAHRVFEGMHRRDLVSWTILIMGYAENGNGHYALELFYSMMHQPACTPSAVCYVAALRACIRIAEKEEGKRVAGQHVKLEALERGLQLHKKIVDSQCDSDVYVSNTLIDMYAKCALVIYSRSVFDSMHYQNVVTWTTLILGYAENGEATVALECFYRMRSQGCSANALTFVAVLKACAKLGALEPGRAVHSNIASLGLQDDLATSCLIDFYARCWCMEDAQRVFDAIPQTNSLVYWTALLSGYSRHGDTDRVFDLFNKMQDQKVKPDGITLLCLLSACSHAGLVDRATQIFGSMSSTYNISPAVEHYNCMVDVFGRANRMDDVVSLVKSMPFAPNAVTWRTVLTACRKWRDLGLGKLAFESLVSLTGQCSTAYVSMASIYERSANNVTI